MPFLLLASGQWQTERTIQTIRRELDTPVHLVTSLIEADELLESHGHTIELALIDVKDSSEFLEVAIPFIDRLDRSYRHIGTILFSSHIPKARLSAFATLRERVDASLQKPFHRNLLLDTIIDAHEKRIRKNRDLVLISNVPYREILPEINIIRHETLAQVELGPEVKALIIDTHAVSPEQAARLKKHLRSNPRPIALWGTEGESAWLLSDTATHYFSADEPLSECIVELSTIADHNLLRRLLIQRIKSALSARQFRRVLSLSAELATFDHRCSQAYTASARALRQLQRPRHAIRQYCKAIEANPFYPENYLGYAELDPNSFRQSSAYTRALRYCPNHPQLRHHLTGTSGPNPKP